MVGKVDVRSLCRQDIIPLGNTSKDQVCEACIEFSLASTIVNEKKEVKIAMFAKHL